MHNTILGLMIQLTPVSVVTSSASRVNSSYLSIPLFPPDAKLLASFNTQVLLIMDSSLFCCGAIQPYRPQALDHESKFSGFLAWANEQKDDIRREEACPETSHSIQLVRQINYGPLESLRYFARSVPIGNMRRYKKSSFYKRTLRRSIHTKISDVAFTTSFTS
ncbi:hypothetical protein HYQ44_010985 [Verticillium longisporum]|nr:hypothetical protein HYQ44_010985 [Verticillium longisporum]